MAKGDYTEVFKGQDGEYRWHRKAANHRIIASSGESFDSKSNAERAAERAYPEQEPEPDDEEAHPVPIFVIIGLMALAFLIGVIVGLWLRDRDQVDVPTQPVSTTIPAEHTQTTVSPTTTLSFSTTSTSLVPSTTSSTLEEATSVPQAETGTTAVPKTG